MTFTERFGSFVCAGDTITCEVDGFTVMAAIVLDDCPDAPDKRQEGFWPSLYINDPGFIGPGPNHRERLAKAKTAADAIMEAWRKGDWFYCGIVLSVSLEGIELARRAASLWGVEANYPGSDNAYLTEVADGLLSEALNTACEAAERLCVAYHQVRAHVGTA
jgi:hypothetical protein